MEYRALKSPKKIHVRNWRTKPETEEQSRQTVANVGLDEVIITQQNPNEDGHLWAAVFVGSSKLIKTGQNLRNIIHSSSKPRSLAGRYLLFSKLTTTFLNQVHASIFFKASIFSQIPTREALASAWRAQWAIKLRFFPADKARRWVLIITQKKRKKRKQCR